MGEAIAVLINVKKIVLKCILDSCQKWHYSAKMTLLCKIYLVDVLAKCHMHTAHRHTNNVNSLNVPYRNVL